MVEESKDSLILPEEITEIDKDIQSLDVENVESDFLKFFELRNLFEKLPIVDTEIFIYENMPLECSFFGLIYEDVDTEVAILDFAKKIVPIYKNYTVVARFTPTMKMGLCSCPRHGNRFMLLHYLFIKEFPNGAFKDSNRPSLAFDAANGYSPGVALSGPARKNIKTFIISHPLTLVKSLMPEDDLEKVKLHFKDLPGDLRYVETLPMISPTIRVLCTSKSFPEDEVLEEYAQKGEQ